MKHIPLLTLFLLSSATITWSMQQDAAQNAAEHAIVSLLQTNELRAYADFVQKVQDVRYPLREQSKEVLKTHGLLDGHGNISQAAQTAYAGILATQKDTQNAR